MAMFAINIIVENKSIILRIIATLLKMGCYHGTLKSGHFSGVFLEHLYSSWVFP